VTLQNIREHKFYRPAVGAVISILCGLALLSPPLGGPWIRASYDNLFRFGARAVTNQVVLVLMDNEAHARLNQSREAGAKWDRALHAKFLEKVAADRCPLVVMDVIFAGTNENPQADAALALALSHLSNVVLNANLFEPKTPGAEAAHIATPLPAFVAAAKDRWGIPRFDYDSDGVVRRHWPFPSPAPSYPSTPWVAAKLSGAHLDDTPRERWFRYYDFQTAWISLSYNFALDREKGYFSNKVVFVGSEPRTKIADNEVDKFRTPHFDWTRETVGGVTLLATEYLNLMNGDALCRWNWPVEALVLVFAGALLGAGLSRFGRPMAVLCGLSAAVVFMLCAVALSFYSNLWFPWLIVVGGEIPCALAWSLLSPRIALAKFPELAPTTVPRPALAQPMVNGAAVHDVFISYVSQDEAVAKAVCAGLEEQKIHCWIAPRDILPGIEYREAILSAIESSRLMVLIFSAQVNASQFVRNEVDCAMEKNLAIIPFLIEDVVPSRGLKFNLGNKHWLKAFPPPLKPFIIQLAEAIKRQLQTRSLADALPVASSDKPAAAKGTIVLRFPEDPLPDAPEYEVFQPPVGSGAFGKVWIVRNAIGQWQALKAVYASNFKDRSPYEAEFKGLQRYKPVSEKHPGLLRIELVSKMKAEGYFYYVMELGDAQSPGWEKQPQLYKPRDLENLRKQTPERRLPVAESVRIISVLADALNFLHQQKLTHRDIKPQNVIFVNGRPKLADIGLVADVRPVEEINTIVGTPGYMPPPPEQPGTPQADIFALGMVLYVISSGYDPGLFPDISTRLMEPIHPDYARVNAIVLKACQPDLAKRYQTTAEMLAELKQALETAQPTTAKDDRPEL